MCNLESHIMSQADPFEFVYEGISGTHGVELMKFLADMYIDIVVDYRLHPDDDFEKIIQNMLDQIEQNC